MDSDVQVLIARLLAHRWLPRKEPQVRRALTDEAFRQELDLRLAACGLCLRDNPYAEHVALALVKGVEQPVFGGEEAWISNNLHLDRDQIALLVVLWAMLILPKRERQLAQRDKGDALLAATPSAEHPVEIVVNKRTLSADFGDKLGRKTRLDMNLGTLARLGFITRRNEDIREGPLLDLAFDYERMAGRILDGALTELLTKQPRMESAEREHEQKAVTGV